MIAFRQIFVKLLYLVLLLFGLQWPIGAAAEEAASMQGEIRLGLTPVILHDQTRNNEALAAYLSEASGRKVKVIQRRTYRQIMDMLKAGQLDFAWICGLPYVRNSSWLEVIATPQNAFNEGRPFYHSLVIVAKDSKYKSMLDLKGKIYAFADPDSNSGHLVPRYLLSRMGANPDNFFMTHMFTYSHSNVVRAVAEGLVDGGSVDSYVLKMLALDEPQLASQVRVLEISDEFAFPPVVSRKGVNPALVRLVRSTLLDMGTDGQGRELLRTLHLTGFSVSSFEIYQPIAEMDEEIFSARPHHDVPTSRANGQ